MRESHGADTEVREGGEEVPQAARAENPSAARSEAGCLLADHERPSRCPCCSPCSSMLEQVEIPRRHCNLWRAQIGEFLLKEAAGHESSTLEQDKKE